MIVFFYGTDVKRQRNEFLYTEVMKAMVVWILMIWLWFAIMLYILRKIANLSHKNFIPSFIKTLIPLIRSEGVHHRLEKIFFGTLLLAIISISPLWSDVFLIQTYQVPDQKIRTFRQLAVIDPPIYSATHSHIDETALKNILRSV